jgi:Mor family transcriptional regulator
MLLYYMSNYIYTARQICIQLNISLEVLKWLRKCGLTFERTSIYQQFLYDLDEVKQVYTKVYIYKKERKIKCIEDFLKGVSINELSRRYKFSRLTIHELVKKAGLSLPRNEIKFDQNTIKKIIADYQQGIPPFILREKYSISKTHLQRILRKNKINNTQKYSKNIYELWQEFLSPEELDNRTQATKQKLSDKSKGENNPMYGKPAPQGSGNGWKGWYKNWFFRSLRELSYMINIIEKNNYDWQTGESSRFKIEYTDPASKHIKNYFPDFVINSSKIVEIKPIKLHDTPLVKSKKQAAENFCQERNLIYELTDCEIMDFSLLKEMADKEEIIFMDKYEIKFREFVLFSNFNN